MLSRRPQLFPPDTRADTSRILAVISRSSWLAITVVAVVLAISVWVLLRARRKIAAQMPMHFLLNSLVIMTMLIFLVLALTAVNILVEPAATLQAFYGVWCLPPPQAALAIFLSVCVLIAVFDAVVGKATAG